MTPGRAVLGSLVTVIGALDTDNLCVGPDARIGGRLLGSLPHVLSLPLFVLGPALLAGGVAILATARTASAAHVDSRPIPPAQSAGALIRIGLCLIAIVSLFSFVATVAGLDKGGMVSFVMTTALLFLGLPGVVLALVGMGLWAVRRLRR